MFLFLFCGFWSLPIKNLSVENRDSILTIPTFVRISQGVWTSLCRQCPLGTTSGVVLLWGRIGSTHTQRISSLSYVLSFTTVSPVRSTESCTDSPFQSSFRRPTTGWHRPPVTHTDFRSGVLCRGLRVGPSFKGSNIYGKCQEVSEPIQKRDFDCSNRLNEKKYFVPRWSL